MAVGAIVGGSSSAVGNGIFFDPDKITAAQNQGGNGASLDSNSGGATSDGTIGVRVTDSGQFTNTLDGNYMFINFVDVYTDGYYEVIEVTDANSVILELAYTSDGTVTSWVVGGACPILGGGGAAGNYDLQDVLDDVTVASAAAQNVNISVTGTGTLTGTIDIDAGGGSVTTTKSIVGVNSSYVDDGSQLTITTSTTLANGLFRYATAAPYIYTKNILFNAAGAGNASFCANLVDAGLDGVNGCVFENCRFTDAADANIRWGGSELPSALVLKNCEIDNAVNEGIETNNAVRGIFNIINTKIHDNGGDGAYFGKSGCSAINSQFYDNGGDGLNIGENVLGCCLIIGNTFTRNDGDGIDFNGTADRAILYNNVAVYNGLYSYKLNGSIPQYFGYNLGTTAGSETAITDAVADGAFAALFGGNNITSTQTEDQLFVTVTDNSEDFTPESGSDLIDGGTDVQTTPTVDIGSIQLDGAGGGGLITHPGMSGGFRG